MKSVCVCVCATRVSVLERSAPRPRGIISAVSCSTVIVWSPLLRMSSAYAVGRRALMSGYSQARTFLERRRRARKKRPRTHRVLLEVVTPSAVDQLLPEVLLEPAMRERAGKCE